MKLKEELREVEVPHTLSLRNNTAVDIEETEVANTEETLSPETLSHRLHQGWQQLQEYSETVLNNNNILTKNDNNNSDVVTSAVAPYLVDGNFRPMSSDESGSSSEDESSVSYSDTSPLLEVSSYDSDVSLYSDMSEDGSLLENSENNNNDDGGAGHLLEASRMSLSSPSLDESSDCSSVSSSKGSPGNKVILPDVLPVGRISNPNDENDDDDLMSDTSLSDVEIKDHDIQPVKEFHVQEECCVVQITSEPDIQVDIRLNSVKTHLKDSSVENKNSYPKSMTDGLKRSVQKRNLYTWSVDDKYDVYNTANKTSVRHWDVRESDDLDKIGVVDGFKTLTVKDAVKPKKNVLQLPDVRSNDKQENVENRKIHTKAVQANIQKRRKNSVSPLPETVCLFGKENQRYPTTHVGLPSKEECHIHSSKTYSQKSQNLQKRSPASPLLRQKENRDNNSNQCSSSKSSSSQVSVSNNVPAANRTAMKKKPKDKVASSPELFEVYTIEAEASHINWVDLRRSDVESEWIRKRRNDREEIRRKLAMDSDTEEFLPEKVNQNTENKPTVRVRDNSNLQICFVNEAVTDEDSPKCCDKVNESVKQCDLLSVPQNVPSQAASSNTSALKNSSRTQNNNSAQSSVSKRQRPNFFFNRPRSMILQKTDQKAGVEDLVSRHIRLQAEAREALAQAKEMAKMQMEIEKQQKKKSPIAEIVGLPFPDGKTYLSHSTLKDMNVAQLQVIVNDLHSQIESLNEDLVKFLLERDDLHMEQDSMLVDIEDLTRYLGLKGSNCVSHPTHPQTSVRRYNASSEKVLKTEPVVKRSHSVQLRKTKNLM